MKEIIVEDFYTFLKHIEDDSKTTIYRGQSNESYKLIPKAFRGDYIKIDDRDAFNYFKRNSVIHFNVSITNDWEYLAFAQHYNIPTRLLDWSLNPLVALFFAVNEMKNENACLFRYDYSGVGIVNLNDNPFELTESGIYIPRAITNRILAQKGLFTIHTKIESETDSIFENRITKFIFKEILCEEIAHRLHRFGITFESLFPDLEGMSRYIEWRWLYRKK